MVREAMDKILNMPVPPPPRPPIHPKNKERVIAEWQRINDEEDREMSLDDVARMCKDGSISAWDAATLINFYGDLFPTTRKHYA